jgi:hypothetical protein
MNEINLSQLQPLFQLEQSVLDSLNDIVIRNKTTIQAEVDAALSAHIAVNRISQSAEPLAERLNQLLALHDSAWRAASTNPAEIAQAIGETYATDVELCFAGKASLPFDKLDKIADYLGGSREWLKFAKGTPFKVETISVSRNPVTAFLELFDIGQKNEVVHLHFVRSLNDAGTLAIVKQYTNARCKILSTNYHVSSQIGATGETDLMTLSLVWHLMYRNIERHGISVGSVDSYLLPDDIFNVLMSGKSHPIQLLHQNCNEFSSTWWEDFWDIEQFISSNYWPGWDKITMRIYNSITEYVPSSTKLKEEIESGVMLDQLYERIIDLRKST